MKTAKYMWQDYKTNEDILSELKINPVEKKLQNYRNKWILHVWQMDRDRLIHLIMKYQPCGKPWG
jgi:tRNA/tmRNA/rRNA uracil-C5-methylase (TrmA/RlmC/RlmD family)